MTKEPMATKRILVVEDNPKSLKLVRDLLEYRGHRVLSAEDGTIGVDKAVRELPDLILMDIQLPGLDGLSATKKLKSDQRTSEIPVIAVTAHARQEDSERIRKAGCDGYITKPIHTKKFVSIVEEALRIEGMSAPPAPETDTPEAREETASFAGTVLVVDDEERNRKLAEATLSPLGFQIRHAASGEEALAAIDENPPDLVLLDVMMPGIDGLEVTRRIRADKTSRFLPIILLTAFADSDRRLKGIEAGCDDFIAKPFDRNELTARIRSLIRMSHYRTRLQDRERLETVLREMGEGIVIVDGQWRIEQLNEPATRLLDIRPESSKGFPLLDHVYGNRVITLDRETLASPETDDLRFEIHRKETERSAALVLSAYARKFRDPDGSVGSIVLTMKDVTGKWSEERMKEDFLSSVSHKLKTPLSVIMANAEALLGEYHGPLTLAQKDALKDLSDSGDQLLDLMNKLFAFVAPGELQGRESYSQPAGQFLDDYLQVLEKRYEDRNVRFTVSLGPGVKERSITLPSVGIILDNLVENAIKFSDGSTTQVSLSVQLRPGQLIEFAVQDNGPGIPAEHLERVFDKFYQVEKFHTGKVEGAGLGLPLARRIVECEDGTIAVDSKLGEGSTFRFTIPSSTSRSSGP